jgi:hypothetical protein
MPIGQDVQIHVKGGTAYPINVSTCGSVWVCAVCSAKIRTRRALEVQAAAAVHKMRGGDVAMLTLTVRHERWMTLSMVLDGLMGSWRQLQQAGEWRALRKTFVGTIRALEVTVGDSGWHPHLHVLLLVQAGRDRVFIDREVAKLHDGWVAGVVSRLGVAPSARRGASLVWMEDASEYVSKLQEAGLEAAYADGKRGRYPFGLLEGVSCGEVSSIELWREYAETMKGRQALAWSAGLRDALALGEEKSDEELAVEEVDGQVADVVPVDVWRSMMVTRHATGILMVEWYLRQIERAWYDEHGPPGD